MGVEEAVPIDTFPKSHQNWWLDDNPFLWRCPPFRCLKLLVSGSRAENSQARKVGGGWWRLHCLKLGFETNGGLNQLEGKVWIPEPKRNLPWEKTQTCCRRPDFLSRSWLVFSFFRFEAVEFAGFFHGPILLAMAVAFWMAFVCGGWKTCIYLVSSRRYPTLFSKNVDTLILFIERTVFGAIMNF